MRTAHIIIGRFLGRNGKINIGGLETYTDSLAELLSKNGFEVFVYEYGKESYEIKFPWYTVRSVLGNRPYDVIRVIENQKHDCINDVLVFATDYLICKNNFKHSIAVQHGVSWDVTSQSSVSSLINVFNVVKGSFRAIRKMIRFKNCNNVVCVDYNFVNWYRTQVKHINERLYVIPNFAVCPTSEPLKEEDHTAIIFARRFVTYRGTKLFTNVIKNVVQKYPYVKVTIAGRGPDEQWMRDELKEYPQIEFTEFESKNSVEFHTKFDIAVVPTLGSEGTSLSLLEAMAAGCAVIATNIGGMTNIILDGYNGLLINPEQKYLEEAICDLIENKDKRNKLAENAYMTVKEAFSYEKWSKKWIWVINNILSAKE